MIPDDGHGPELNVIFRWLQGGPLLVFKWPYKGVSGVTTLLISIFVQLGEIKPR